MKPWSLGVPGWLPGPQGLGGPGVPLLLSGSEMLMTFVQMADVGGRPPIQVHRNWLLEKGTQPPKRGAGMKMCSPVCLFLFPGTWPSGQVQG